MPATNISAAQRDANIAKVASQAAEAALCHYAYLNGVGFSDPQFEIQKRAMAFVIQDRLEWLAGSDAKARPHGI